MARTDFLDTDRVLVTNRNGTSFRGLLSQLVTYVGSFLRPYKVYIARIVATGTNDPTTVIMENTIGDIVWDYESGGTYNGVLSGAFPANKVWCLVSSYLPVTSAWEMRSLDRYDNNTLKLYNMGASGPISGTMTVCSIEIRVYN